MTWEAPPEIVTLDVEMPKPQPFVLDPTKTAVVIVDMEDFFVKNPSRPGRMGDTIAGNAVLLAKAREAGAEVIYIQSVRVPGVALEVERFGQPWCRDNMESVVNGLDVNGPGINIAEEIAPLPGEAVVQKWGHDPFARTELENVLTEKGIDNKDWTVLVTGVSAAVCAHACALGFSNRHYMTLIPMDCTAAGTVEDEARTYAQYMSGGYNFNMAFTHSDLVTFEVGATPAEEQVQDLVTI